MEVEKAESSSIQSIIYNLLILLNDESDEQQPVEEVETN